MGEKLLFHGTSIDNLESILENDLLLNANHSNGTVFGKGVYFTNNINRAMKYSPSSKKCIMICKVHIGEITKGERTMVVPPKGYDTTVNILDNPDIFVKYKSRTFKIVGYLKIEDKKTQCISVSFKNTKDESIGIYYIPENIDPLKLVYGGVGDPTSGPLSQCNKMGFIDPNKYRTIKTFIGHKFICTTKDYIIQIIQVKQSGEIIV